MDSTFKTDIKSKILSIKGQINDSRTSFIFPSLHKVEVTPFWLLGFIEIFVNYYLIINVIGFK